MTTETQPTNRLIWATSPYLLQHAHNPVDWFEWGAEALEKARHEDKPIFLSIGYAACHWCHVMEHESFEQADVAAVLNESFISIKVDREERPDLDEIYMAYTQALTRHGGWPMSVWLTPEGAPFHAGTYFPKESFMELLRSIARTWRDNREDVTSDAEQAKAFFGQWTSKGAAAEGVITRDAIDRSALQIARYFDRSLGGISGGGPNKFPPSMTMDLLLRVHRRTSNKDLLDAVTVTLDHMGRGGIYDQLGGGICRYSTDREWLVPHFEKMLYDQAMVSAIYLDAYQATRNPFYAFIGGDILDYVIKDLQSPDGGFYSSRDADSDGLEGAFYIWTVGQIRDTLGEQDAQLFCKYYDVTETGNWFERLGHAPPGPKNILHISKPQEVFAKLHNLSTDELNEKIKSWRSKLLQVRSQRTPPTLDDKILTAWNGLMIASMAKGAVVLDQRKYGDAAGRAADFVLKNLRQDGRLLRTYRKGQARLTAYLDDYAFLIEGLLNLYEFDFESRWLDEAAALTDTAIQYYGDAGGGAFFYTAGDAEKLLARSKQPHDNAIPSGNSVMAMNLLRLALLLDRKDYRAKAESIFRAFAKEAEQSPTAFDRLLCAADFYHDRVKEIVILGDRNDAAAAAMFQTVYERYLPNKVVVHAKDKADDAPLPLLKGKGRVNGRATAFVCENYTCKLPVLSAAELGKLLDAK